MLLVSPPRRLDIAHDFMHAFALWRASQPGLPSFAAFVRLFDPTVPTHPGGDDGYMRHRTYMKACYLQKLAKR
jgi:hypothetical protein